MAKTFDKALIRAELCKAWKSEKMVDYCTKQIASVAILPDGGIVTIEKQGIEKRFCFGESGYDIDEAISAAEHARTSEDYFRSKNMASFNGYVKDLQDMLDNIADGSCREYLVIYDTHYINQSDDCRLRNIGFYRTWEILNAFGGSYNLEEAPGKRIHIDGRDCHIATDEEINCILEAYKTARDAHEKRVDTYLKKYGLTQMRSWTYWRDA